MQDHPPTRPQLHHVVSFDTALPEYIKPVTYYPAKDGRPRWCLVRLTADTYVNLESAADAQELETRFAAARRYLTDEPADVPAEITRLTEGWDDEPEPAPCPSSLHDVVFCGECHHGRCLHLNGCTVHGCQCIVTRGALLAVTS